MNSIKFDSKVFIDVQAHVIQKCRKLQQNRFRIIFIKNVACIISFYYKQCSDSVPWKLCMILSRKLCMVRIVIVKGSALALNAFMLGRGSILTRQK
jgi:hypothetical protein